VKLLPTERVRLLELVPDRGNILTLKILRKLRESLSFSEEDMRHIAVTRHYACGGEERENDGKVNRCKTEGFFSGPTKCAEHDREMEWTGRVSMMFAPEFGGLEKDVFMGPQALTIATEAVKTLEKMPELPLSDLALYEKFFPPDKDPTA